MLKILHGNSQFVYKYSPRCLFLCAFFLIIHMVIVSINPWRSVIDSIDSVIPTREFENTLLSSIKKLCLLLSHCLSLMHRFSQNPFFLCIFNNQKMLIYQPSAVFSSVRCVSWFSCSLTSSGLIKLRNCEG